MITTLTLLAANVVAITALTFGLYLRRHGRRDLVPAFIGVNIGVFAVASVLGATQVSLAVGLGLFGVLSIIRLRSTELSQHEVAYYFAALALGLVAGLPTQQPQIQLGLLGLVVLALAVGDHPALVRGSRQQVLVLDQAIADERELHDRVGAQLSSEHHQARVQHLTVLSTDLVNDSMRVDVRYRLAPRAAVTGDVTAPPPRPRSVHHHGEPVLAPRPGATDTLAAQGLAVGARR